MKFLVIRKRHLVFAAGVILALAIFWAVNSPPTVAASVATRQLPIYCVDRDDNVISISFDAAWGAVILRQNIFTLIREVSQSFRQFAVLPVVIEKAALRTLM